MKTSGAQEDFNALAFEKRLTQLKDTQDSISALSNWCLQKREHHKKIVASWLNVLKRAKVEQRLTLFYLANDVIQYSKRKNYEFVESWGTTLQKATPLVRDDKVKHRILRIFRIWEERQIYDEEFLTDLTGLLSVTAGKQLADFDPNDFQAIQLVNKIRQCSKLEADTDQQLKQIHEYQLPLNDPNLLCSSLKERRDTEEAKQDLEEGIVRLEGYVQALQKELVARGALCYLLQKAHTHYATQRGEVKVVANAYKNFGSRVRGLKRKLDELYDALPSTAVSPVPSPPSPGEAVPSPGPDEDIDLPSATQDTSNTSTSDNMFATNAFGKDIAGKGFSSFVGSEEFSFASFRDNLTALNHNKNEAAKKIEVINSRPGKTNEPVDINTLIKSLIPSRTSPATIKDNAYHTQITPPPPPPPPLLPGLDLLNSGDAVDSVPPLLPPSALSFYGSNSAISNRNSIDSNSNSYVPENVQSSQWNSSWDMQRIVSADTPESPPVEQLRSPPPPPIIPVPPPIPDIDHRQLLAPPPALPQGLLHSDDTDHRQLPPLPPPIQSDRARLLHKDVDHRNLISLTMGSLPPPPAPPITPWTPQSSLADQDYRGMNEEFSALVPPPLPLMSIPPPRRIPSHNDNVESIDMEMSDDELLESHDDDYNRHLRIESSMARIHGQPPPPPPHHNQPPPAFRKQDLSARDKSFSNNNRHFDMNISENHSNNAHNEKSMSRINLVRINSSDVLDNGSDKEAVSKNDYPENSQTGVEHSASAVDIFNDFQPNSMNPINPNLNCPPDLHQDVSNDMKNDDDWENPDEEIGDSWSNHPSNMYPTQSNFSRNRSRPPRNNNFRRPPPLLSTPSYMDDQHYGSPHNSRAGGNNNFRRPWGNPRSRRGMW